MNVTNLLFRKASSSAKLIFEANPGGLLITGISSDSDITVVSTVNGETVRSEYPKDTSDIFVESDPGTQIKLSGRKVKVSN